MATVVECRNIHEENEIASSDSETEAEEYGDKDYDEIRRNFKPILNLGQTLTALWPISVLEQTGDDDDDNCGIENISFIDGPSLSKSLDWPSGSIQGNFFETKHTRSPSLPSYGKIEQIKLSLDEIILTPDEEYGFNPRRRRSRLGHAGRRSVSLYAAEETADRLLKMANASKLTSNVLSASNLQEEKSHARNAEEAKIEEDIACLRAQPSNVEFNRKCQAKSHYEELMKRRMSRRKWSTGKLVGRKLSFDSHPRCRTFSEGAKPPCDLYDNIGSKASVDKSGHQSFLFNEVGSDPILYGSEPILNPQQQEIKLAPPPILSSKTDVEVLVSTVAEKRKKRRAGIPQFLTALRLPNKKKIKKFMKKKSERHPVSGHPKITHRIAAETVDVNTERGHSAEYTNDAQGQVGRSPSMNTFARKSSDTGCSDSYARKQMFTYTVQSARNSCSMCSLQKLEEGKEMSDFDGTLNRKSCSTCSIAFARVRANSKDDSPVLERRLSDTVLTWKDERQPSCSPGRRFIRKLLSPVVCGLTNEKYMTFQSSDSYSSLASCNSDTSAEADLLTQKLTDFDVHEIAEELALIDKELLIRITWQELATCGWMSINKYITSPNVMNMVEFFNRVAMMVATGILVEETAYLRAKAITKMVKLAMKCHHLKNYNSLRAVLAGLQCTPIYRLEGSWKQVRARRKKMFGELSTLMSEDQNFSSYREELKNSLKDSPCLPFLGDFLTQIAQTQAYVAMRRKRSLAKQRMEKASVSSHTEKVTSAVNEKEACSSQCSKIEGIAEHEGEACVGDKKLGLSDAEKIEICGEENNSNHLPGNEEKISDVSFTGNNDEENNDKENSKDFVSNFGFDEVDKNSGNTEKENQIELPDLIEESDELSHRHAYNNSLCDEPASLELDGDEYVNLNRKERESIRRSIHGITKAMFQNGSSYQSSENDNEFLEALNEYLENEAEQEISVFVDTEAQRGKTVGSNSPAIDIQNKKYLGSCSDDNGVGSASSYELSPTIPESNRTGFLVDHLVDQDNAEKKTHARNDSNDSGVVLQNGRLSRASEELSGSRDNLHAVVSDSNCSNPVEDSKVAHDTDPSVEEKGVVDGRSCKLIPILDRNCSEMKKLEEKIKRGRPIEEETKHKKELQFWEYQVAAMKYQLTQRPLLRKYLLSACYNSEEENYSMSLKREPIIKRQ